MGKKYSINSAGRIVAERDIYSLGGFIPKGTVGGSIKDETQLSQEGECWLNAGDISTRPDVRIKDNAYIGNFFTNESPVHTDGIMEFSGNTLIPGHITIRCPQADPKNNVFVKDSFIGVSMNILPGPRTTATAFPFEQGGYLSTAPRGTAFSSSVIQTQDINLCRSTDAVIRCGLNTYVYLPTGYSGRILWAYTQGGTAVYSGESKVIPSGLTKIEHPVYNQFMLHINKINGTAMTPADLLATGAKILGHISGSLLQDFRPESVSGEYAIVNSSLIAETDNFGLATTQLRFLAGGLYNTNMYTLTNRQDYKPYGTFRNVERLEYIQYFADIHRGNANRDHYIVASDSPLVRINDGFVSGDLVNSGGVTLHNCIVPKGVFQNDVISGNTYEDIDFSYTNEFMGDPVGNRVFVASRRPGLYSLYAGSGNHLGLASYPDNVKDATSITEKHDYMSLDGDIIEQGSYLIAFDKYYEDQKTMVADRVRTGRPLSTYGISFPSLPSGFKVSSIVYLRDDFKIQTSQTDPTSVDTENPYFVMNIAKTDNSPITASEFIALNVIFRMSDYTKVPEITGSAYVGAGCTVRGDVQLQGDPYVNRIFDVNVWERGTASASGGKSWEDSKTPTAAGNRFRFIDVFPVEPGGLITCKSGYWVECHFFDSNGLFISTPGWGRTSNYAPARSAYVGIVIKKSESASEAGGLITEEDIALANVKYLRAFKKRRYITNELDRKSPEDVLLSVDYWEQGYVDRIAGKTYEDLKSASSNYVRLKRPVNTGKGATYTHAAGYARITVSLDATTKCVSTDNAIVDGTPLCGVVLRKDPAAPTAPTDVSNIRLILEFVPSPRIIVPYGSNTLIINGVKIRMYDNSVLSRNFNQEGGIVLKGDAVMGYDFDSGNCMCSNGHSDAIIKLP